MTKKGKIILTSIVVLLLVAIAAIVSFYFIFMRQSYDLDSFQHLKNPAITDLPDQNMLVVEVSGNPNVVSNEAFSELFSAYGKLRKDHPDMTGDAPRGRWNFAPGAEKSVDDLTGFYGLPIPNAVTESPSGSPDNVLVQNWTYGETAEILHVGPYSEEDPTIDKLRNYIENQGYEISGDHEEVYLKGPGMFLAGNPNKYQTIIRYPVKKITDAEDNSNADNLNE